MQHSSPFQLATLRNKTFQDLLNQYVADDKLKAILSFPILGNGGLPSSLISAFTATILYTEFYLDGGYYPDGGMQALPDALADRFIELGGELRLSCGAKKINVEYHKVTGVVIGDSEAVSAKYVISCCDAWQTFLKLITSKAVNKTFLNTIRKLQPSPSFFIAYLGTHGSTLPSLAPGASVWVMPDYSIEALYGYIRDKAVDSASAFMLRVPPDNKSFKRSSSRLIKASNIGTIINVKSWRALLRESSGFSRGLSGHIQYQEAATPHTLYRYTLNYKGAAYGWASMPSQLFTQGLMQKTPIENLYLAGHWTTQTQGISGAAYIGNETAKLILRRAGRYHTVVPT